MLKKCIAICLCFVALTGILSACNEPQTGNDSLSSYDFPTAVPVFADDKQVEIMAFWSPPINETQYTWLKECGITAVLVDNKYNANTGTNRKKILTMCGELGIDVYFPLDRNCDGQVVEQFAEWAEYPAFKGLYCDEPITKKHIDNINEQYEAMCQIDPDLIFIANMLGGYEEDATAYSWIYDTDAEFQQEVADGQFFENYQAYMAYYQETVVRDRKNVRVSATNYPLLNYDMYTTTLDSAWLSTLGNSKQLADEYGTQLWQFIATTAYHSGGNTNYHRQPTEADIRWQAYAALAYGATGIEEFVYTTVGAGAEFTAEDHGPIWWVDQNQLSGYYRTETYDYAQAVHQEIAKFDHVLLSFQWQGVLCKTGDKEPDTVNVAPVFENAVGVLDGHDAINTVENQRDLLIGCFADDNGYDGFLVVNFSETAHNSHLQNEIRVQFNGATRALTYVKGEEELVELDNGTYSITLMPGEAVFIIPLA